MTREVLLLGQSYFLRIWSQSSIDQFCGELEVVPPSSNLCPLCLCPSPKLKDLLWNL